MKNIEAKNRLIVALDVPTSEEVENLVNKLRYIGNTSKFIIGGNNDDKKTKTTS